jgi:hypothetical protein
MLLSSHQSVLYVFKIDLTQSNFKWINNDQLLCLELLD